MLYSSTIHIVIAWASGGGGGACPKNHKNHLNNNNNNGQRLRTMRRREMASSHGENNHHLLPPSLSLQCGGKKFWCVRISTFFPTFLYSTRKSTNLFQPIFSHAGPGMLQQRLIPHPYEFLKIAHSH